MSYCLLSGEQSGDQLAASLLTKLDAPCFGMGSTEMEKTGCEIIESPLHVMGFAAVAFALPKILAQMARLQKAILKRNPKAVITIDNPDFSMFIAKRLRKKGYKGKLIHLVSPSVWAWRKNRIHTLANTIDHLFTILPFEASYYEKTSLPVTYIGHPLVHTVSLHKHSPLNLPEDVIALFPGSRSHEISDNLPLQLEAAKGHPIAISVARPELEPLIRCHTNAPLIPADKRYDLMHQAKAAIATSGTIVLELGLCHTPTIVTYKLSPFNYLLTRYLFRVHLPYYTLPNLVCEREIFPEFIHKTIDPREITCALVRLIANPQICKNECARLMTLLNEGDSSEKAANIIMSMS